MDTIDKLNREVLEMKEAYNQLDAERQNLLSELDKQSLAADQNQMRTMTGIYSCFVLPSKCIDFNYFRESIITKHVERII